MDTADLGPARGPAQEAIQRELDLIDSAIAMVAAHPVDRVTVGGLRFGRQMLDIARRHAALAHVRVVPVWEADGSVRSFRVELDTGDAFDLQGGPAGPDRSVDPPG